MASCLCPQNNVGLRNHVYLLGYTKNLLETFKLHIFVDLTSSSTQILQRSELIGNAA